MPAISPQLRQRIRQLLADTSGQILPDYATPEPDALRTIPVQLQKPEAEAIGGIARKGLGFGNAVASTIAQHNPAALAEYAAHNLLSKFSSLQEKQAAVYAETIEPFDFYTKRASDAHTKALDVLRREPPVSVALLALKRLFGDEFSGWEPETLFWELDDLGLEVDDALQDRINCGLALALQPAFLNDLRVFENCVRVLCSLDTNVTITQKPDIAHMCAAVYEARLIMDREQNMPEDAEFSDSVAMYCGVALAHDHYLLAPHELQFAQRMLDTLNSNTSLIVPSIKKRWSKYQEGFAAGRTEELEENIIDIQVGKLAGCYMYVEERMKWIEAFTDAL